MIFYLPSALVGPPLRSRARSAVAWIRRIGAFSYVDLAVKAYDLVKVNLGTLVG